MRVAVISPPWLTVPPVAYGGTEAVLDALCRGLADAGHEVLLYCTGDSTCPVERAWTFDAAVGVEHMTTPALVHHVLDAYTTVGDWDAEVVHDHTLLGPLCRGGCTERTIVTTSHGPFNGSLGCVYRALAGRAPIIAISRHHATSAGDIPLAGVIHHGLDLTQFPTNGADGDHAVFLGRMNADKGVRTAVLAARAAGLPLRIAAKMRERSELEYFRSEVEPLLGGDVEYLGEVGGEEKLRLLAGARCLLNPINWPEPFGMVMIEALACGTPVVATRRGSAPEIVTDGVTGYLCDDLDSLVTALGRVGRLDRGACRADAEARFSMARLAGDHARLFERLQLDPDGLAGEADDLLVSIGELPGAR